MLHVGLNPGIPGGRFARLRPLRGHDEASVNGAGSVDLIAFLDRLLTNAPGTTVGPGRATDLAVCDCDRLCASIYLDYFGECIEGRVACDDCREFFDLSFSLADLMGKLADDRTKASGPDPDGVFTLANGCRFRLPTAGDERASAGLDPDEAVSALLGRCIVEGEPAEDRGDSSDNHGAGRSATRYGARRQLSALRHKPKSQVRYPVVSVSRVGLREAVSELRGALHREGLRLGLRRDTEPDTRGSQNIRRVDQVRSSCATEGGSVEWLPATCGIARRRRHRRRRLFRWCAADPRLPRKISVSGCRGLGDPISKLPSQLRRRCRTSARQPAVLL